MVYKKITTIAFILAIVFAIMNGFVFASDSAIATNDKIYGTVLNILVKIQKYSWPVVTLIFIYAMYEYYVIGSEMLEHKITGQRLIVGIAIFMALLQSLPLVYAFATV